MPGNGVIIEFNGGLTIGVRNYVGIPVKCAAVINITEYRAVRILRSVELIWTGITVNSGNAFVQVEQLRPGSQVTSILNKDINQHSTLIH